jgi:hypothetical protein
MGKTSNKAKDQYNRANYTQVKVHIKPDIAVAFKAACEADNVSMASEISRFMASRASAVKVSMPSEKDLLTSRGGRRKLTASITQTLKQIKDAEEQYRDEGIPANLQGSIRYANAEQSIQVLEEILNIIADAY